MFPKVDPNGPQCAIPNADRRSATDTPDGKSGIDGGHGHRDSTSRLCLECRRTAVQRYAPAQIAVHAVEGAQERMFTQGVIGDEPAQRVVRGDGRKGVRVDVIHPAVAAIIKRYAVCLVGMRIEQKNQGAGIKIGYLGAGNVVRRKTGPVRQESAIDFQSLITAQQLSYRM